MLQKDTRPKRRLRGQEVCCAASNPSPAARGDLSLYTCYVRYIEMHECLRLSASRWFPSSQRSRGGVRAGVPQPASKTLGLRRSAAKAAPAHLSPGTSCTPDCPPQICSSSASVLSPGFPGLPRPSPHPHIALLPSTVLPSFSGLCPPPCPAQERLKKPEARKGNTVEETDEK